MSSGRRSLPKGEERKYVIQALKSGWKIQRQGNDHFLLIGPEGQHVICSATPRRYGRSLKNFKAELRRGGLRT